MSRQEPPAATRGRGHGGGLPPRGPRRRTRARRFEQTAPPRCMCERNVPKATARSADGTHLRPIGSTLSPEAPAPLQRAPRRVPVRMGPGAADSVEPRLPAGRRRSTRPRSVVRSSCRPISWFRCPRQKSNGGAVKGASGLPLARFSLVAVRTGASIDPVSFTSKHYPLTVASGAPGCQVPPLRPSGRGQFLWRRGAVLPAAVSRGRARKTPYFPCRRTAKTAGC